MSSIKMIGDYFLVNGMSGVTRNFRRGGGAKKLHENQETIPNQGNQLRVWISDKSFIESELPLR